MKRYLTFGITFGVLVVAIVLISWFGFPAWHDPASGGFWTLLGATIIGVWAFLQGAISVWKDLKEEKKEEPKSPTPASLQSIESQKADSIYNAPGGTINVNKETSNKSIQYEQDLILPRLELKLIDGLKQHVDRLVFSQTTNIQDFHFGIALINEADGSMPAEKLDISIECSWDGSDMKAPPKFKADLHNRTTPGWIASKELVQQGEIPFPAKLSFHGTTDYRCAYGHSLEWYRFSVVLFEKMNGRFILNYKISSASPRLVTDKGALFIIIDSGKFGTKSVILSDILSGEELHIEFNLSADTIEINGVLVNRVQALESKANQFVFCPVGVGYSKLYHLSRSQIEMMKAL